MMGKSCAEYPLNSPIFIQHPGTGVFFQTNMRIVAGGIGRGEQNQLALWSQQRPGLPDQFPTDTPSLKMGVDRQIGDYMQVGAGYNFADFSDDLRILDYEQKGWFVNLVGKF